MSATQDTQDGETVDVLALIPARSGSKGIVDKNIRSMAGKPMLAWSIEQALASTTVTRTVVSTDSEEYAHIAKQYGAEVPFLRPAELAADHSTDLDVFLHTLEWLERHESYVPEVCVHLRPTYPVRRVSMIDDMVRLLCSRPDVDAVRTVTEAPHTPFKMWFRDADGMLQPVLRHPGVEEPWNEPRQKLPPTYWQTANIDVVRRDVIVVRRSMTGRRIYGFPDERFFDIDSESELRNAERELWRRAGEGPSAVPGTHTGRTFCFDIDGVIASLVPENDYRKAQPIPGTIRRINALHDRGHRIILFTARGSVTGQDWEAFTAEQMKAWGVRYHELRLGKPAADFYIDDRMVLPGELDNMLE